MTTTEQERERPAAKIERGLSAALEFVKAIKPQDSRPRRKMWAPGGYVCKCLDCGCQFVGDKRAISCADCAYS